MSPYRRYEAKRIGENRKETLKPIRKSLLEGEEPTKNSCMCSKIHCRRPIQKGRVFEKGK